MSGAAVLTEADIAAGNAVRCLACGFITRRLQWTHFRKRCSLSSLDEYMAEFPGAPLISESLKKQAARTKENFIKEYGEELGLEKWNTYRDKQAASNTFEYKNSKYGWSREQFDEYNAGRAVTLENLVARHGHDVGTQKYDAYRDAQRYTNTLDYFVGREGSVEVGTEAWKRYNHEKGKAVRAEDVAKKLGISVEDAADKIHSRWSEYRSSKPERDFVENLETRIGFPLKYTFKTKQFCIWSADLGQPVFYDICCTDRMKIIEFYGDYWHANPSKYESGYFFSRMNKTAQEIWEIDRLKIATAANRGFTTFVVWESEVTPEKVDEVAEWLMS